MEHLPGKWLAGPVRRLSQFCKKSVQGGERGGERRYFGLAQAGGCTGDQCFVECRVAFQRGPRGRCQRHRHAALVPAAAGADARAE